MPQGFKTETNFTPHYNSLSRLSINAKSCELCYLIQSSIDLFLKGLESELEIADYELWLSGRADADGFQILGREKGQDSLEPYYYIMGGVGFALDNGEYSKPSYDFSRRTRWLMAVVVESHLNNIVQRRPVPLSPLSSSVLERIRGWVEECTEKHGHTLPQVNFMPTRLLEIGDLGRQVRLYLPSTKHSKYAVLSHCWGSMAPTTLTSRSLHRFEAGIRTDELPQTFQDAVWLTHQLKIQFLWIDSLCIVQDDPDDWAQESAMMHNVGDPKRKVWIEHEPLSHRGWALQERYLSRRTLHFASDQIFFECEKFCLAEDTFKNYQYPSFSEIMSSGRLSEMDDESYFKEWYRLVEKYSMRALTIRDDKLPALSGLAAYFSGERSVKYSAVDLSNQYLAGLWSDDIISGLCWVSHISAPRLAKYRAPSWSWASVDGPIGYGPYYSLNELAVVENTHVDLESPGRCFGKVLGGWISMKVIKLWPRADSVTDTGNLRFFEDGVSFEVVCFWDLDSAVTSGRRESVLSIMEETELLVIPLRWGENPDDGVWRPQFLILKPADCTNHSQTAAPIFQRIGFGQTMIELEGDEDINDLKLKRLIIDKWVVMKQQGNLEDIVII
ncbi:hypothetical protein CIB48_g9920 [Xylaria polymorpha]|nr:hypothetical protein CIB48_g9920 [Xylaria polymorpha]